MEIAKRRGASNCFHFSVMIEEEREHRSAVRLSAHTAEGATPLDARARVFAPVERIYSRPAVMAVSTAV